MVEDVFIRKPFNYDMAEVSLETGLRCEDESLASQEFREEVDINTIAMRFGLFGELPQDVRAPTFGDFEEVVDYQTALNAVRQAGESFMEMPAHVRARFHNDPQEFVVFCSDVSNRDEARKLGLLAAQQEELGTQAALPVTAAVETPPA